MEKAPAPFLHPQRNDGTLLFDRMLDHPAQSGSVHGIGLVDCHYRFPESKNLWITLGIGYLTGVLSVWIYWHFAASYTPTQEIADEIMTTDGTPQVLTPFVMPIFVCVSFALRWPITWLLTKISPRKELAWVNNPPPLNGQ